MPGPLKGPGKFWNIDPIWGYILLILATNCAFWFSLYFQFDQTFLTPPLIRKFFWSLHSGNSKHFWPPPFCPTPTKVFMNAPLMHLIPQCLSQHWPRIECFSKTHTVHFLAKGDSPVSVLFRIPILWGCTNRKIVMVENFFLWIYVH